MVLDLTELVLEFSLLIKLTHLSIRSVGIKDQSLFEWNFFLGTSDCISDLMKLSALWCVLFIYFYRAACSLWNRIRWILWLWCDACVPWLQIHHTPKFTLSVKLLCLMELSCIVFSYFCPAAWALMEQTSQSACLLMQMVSSGQCFRN